MKFIADLHVHSSYSRATSKQMNLENLYRWAQLKGVTVVGTGDFTHPEWFKEIQKKLEPAEPGLFALKKEYCREMDAEVPQSCRGTVRFLLSSEISSIYKKNEKVRKVHNLIFFPNLESTALFNGRLQKVGNVASDGRPILGLDSKELLKMALAASDEVFFVPAHIWTPHFSVLGASSGFDSLEECFDELTPHIRAVETGLSSDPPMNRRLSALDKVTLISNSDAHSPDKLAREGNMFFTDLSYYAMIDALKNSENREFQGTIEFFPEEGKYHLDGHRACGQRLTPEETRTHEGRCPVCGKKVTIGVVHRVAELADRAADSVPPGKPSFVSLVGLAEILSEILEKGAKTKTVGKEYFRLLNTYGTELSILMRCPLEDLDHAGVPLLSRAIDNVRNRTVSVLPGYDGEYGVVRALSDEDKMKASKQGSLF